MRNYDIVGGKKGVKKMMNKKFYQKTHFIFIIIMNLHIFHVHDWKNSTKKMESTEKSFNF